VRTFGDVRRVKLSCTAGLDMLIVVGVGVLSFVEWLKPWLLITKNEGLY
jgi:hypothetical protein